jgi:hypothetical protein
MSVFGADVCASWQKLRRIELVSFDRDTSSAWYAIFRAGDVPFSNYGTSVLPRHIH